MTGSDDLLTQIQEKRNNAATYEGGGHPHTYVELFGGHMVEMLSVEPDVLTYRDDYYYNVNDNNLYIKKAEWSYVARAFDDEDESYVYYGGRSVKKTIKIPDPKKFGDQYYFHLPSNKLFGRIIKWVKCTNL